MAGDDQHQSNGPQHMRAVHVHQLLRVGVQTPNCPSCSKSSVQICQPPPAVRYENHTVNASHCAQLNAAKHSILAF